MEGKKNGQQKRKSVAERTSESRCMASERGHKSSLHIIIELTSRARSFALGLVGYQGALTFAVVGKVEVVLCC